MTRYLQPKFSVGGANSQAYRDNYDRIFRKPKEEPPAAPVTPSCDHGVTFDEQAAQGLDVSEVRSRWPRLYGPCPKGCGFSGIAYAGLSHYIHGDW